MLSQMLTFHNHPPHLLINANVDRSGFRAVVTHLLMLCREIVEQCVSNK